MQSLYVYLDPKARILLPDPLKKVSRRYIGCLLCLIDLSDRLFDLVGSKVSDSLDRCTLHRDEQHHRDATYTEDLS